MRNIAFILFTVGVICHLAFYLIGSKVGDDGRLTEPFFLLPVGYFFYTLGVVWLLVLALKKVMRRMQRR